MKEDARKELLKVLLKLNRKKPVQEVKAKVEKLTALQQKAVDVAKAIVDGDFGCRTEEVRSLMEVVLGVKVVLPERVDKDSLDNFAVGQAIIPLKKENGHSYKLGEMIVIVTRHSEAIRQDGTIGNHMDRDPDTYREATSKEITEYVKKMPDELVRRLLRTL